MSLEIDAPNSAPATASAMNATGLAVELRGVSKRFGSVEALRDVSFSVRRGEVVALLGPNGAGKTTAISIMLGLRQPTTGKARLLGLNPRDRQARSQCGVMLQDSGVPMTLSVRELIELFRGYYPHPLPVARVVEMADLGGKANTRAGTLSGGQRQRLYFALAVCGDPDVLFLDEPTAALDVEARREFWAQVRDFVRSGKTILLTTHYLEEADALADRVLVIARGQLVADATPARLKAQVAGKRLRFMSSQQVDERVFADLPISRLEVNAHEVTLLSPEPEAVLRTLFARNILVRDLEVTGATLEEAIIDLTSR
ncbi:MAG TPA: ABC transporter ATP-binding protein [Ktedonobacterales bacterium]|nr:ABC transporter ATP-binding protein [Ktedonobacterales bacterium]